MGAAWKTIPLFTSSTFRDMHAERNQLNLVVFPALDERLKGRRCRLEPIDLRVGVETDSTKTERERELQMLNFDLGAIGCTSVPRNASYVQWRCSHPKNWNYWLDLSATAGLPNVRSQAGLLPRRRIFRTGTTDMLHA